MKLPVPFFKQTTPLNCGPCALKMVFAFFRKDIDLDKIESVVGIKDGKGVSTIKLAIASAEFGFKTGLFSKSIYFDESNLKLDFCQKPPVKDWWHVTVDYCMLVVFEHAQKHEKIA